MKKFITYVFPVTAVLVAVVNIFFSNPQYPSLEKELEEYKLLGDIQKQNIIYWKLIHADSSHVANHFNFISTYFQLPIANNGMGRGEFLEYNTVVDYYRHFLGSSKSEVSDIGKFGRGMCFYHTGYIEEALTSFVNI